MIEEATLKSLNKRQILNVRAYVIQRIEKVKKRVHYYFDWKSFSVGASFCKTTGFSGWKYMLSFDLGFFSFWIYFSKIDNIKNV